MGSKIISRAVLVALLSTCVGLVALQAAAEDDCALYLNGPGRTSAYDYSLNLLKGNFGYEGQQHTCITYDAVNQAYLEARNRIVVSTPKGDWKAEDFASAGELILDISINLARRYGLTYEEIEKGLPLIDTSRTLIRDICPPVFSHVECRAGKYRRQDGLCNNLEHPTWGSTMAPFQRLIGPLFSDGINAPRVGHTGRDLPLSRVVSRTMHPDDGYHDHAGTVMVIAWGQFMDHDYTLTGTPLDPVNRNDPEECCARPPHRKHPYCNEIRIPDDDYFYRLWGVKCIDFVRAFPSPRPGCRLGSRVPFNTLTGAIDGNTVYGVTEKFSRKLRTGYGGLLRMNPVFKEYGLKDLLPLKLDIPDEGCTRPNKNMYCFEGGEIRVNEQLVLTVMHTLMAREHNRVAKGLAAVNPHWDDETIFQEARRINIAEIQHITYNEFLPILLGKDVMEKFGLVLEKKGFWEGYDPNVNPDVIDAFASAAFRFGHSLLPTAVERWSKAHKFIASKRLSDLIRRPYDLYRAGVLDEYVMGLMNQVAQAMDDSITQEVTNHLFKKVGARFGMDLVSFNMQRGREFGIPGYMEYRKFCGLGGADTFQDLFGSMPNETVRKYETIFEHPIDVDLWSGGVSERPLPGSMLGPTFACVIATQFSYSRRGDRFWFELPNQPSSFTPEQLHEIRKSRLARVICDNTDIIDTVQLYPMVLPDHELNPRVPCRSGILPSMDFSKWAEPAPFHGGAKPFVTDAYVTVKNETKEEDEYKNSVNITNSDVSNNTTIDSLEQVNNTPKTQQQLPDLKTQTTACKNYQNTTGQNCTESKTNCPECNIIKLKETHSSDTVLKYVYKNDAEIKASPKSSGHSKNSLKRRKRSANHSGHVASAPLIVDYETSHTPQAAGPKFERHTADVIRNSDLADYNIETLHDIQPQDIANKYTDNKNNREQNHQRSDEGNDKRGEEYLEEKTEYNKKYKQDSESEERSEYTSSERKPQSSDESVENFIKNKKTFDENYDDKDKSKETYRNEKNNKPFVSKDSNEKRDENTSPEIQHGNRDSEERTYSAEKSDYQATKDDERNDYRGKPNQNDRKFYESREREHDSSEKGENYSGTRKDSNEYDAQSKTRLNDRLYAESRERGEHESGEKGQNDSSEKKHDDYDDNANPKQNYQSFPESRERKIHDSDEKGDNGSNERYSERSQEKDSSREEGKPYYKAPYSAVSKDSNEGGEQSGESDYPKNRENVYHSGEDNKQNYETPHEATSESNESQDHNEKITKFPISESSSESNYKNNDTPKNYHQLQQTNGSEEDEAIIAIMTKKNKRPNHNEDEFKHIVPEKITDVDLDDFGHEQIQINDKGVVVPVKESHDSYNDTPLSAPLTSLGPAALRDSNDQLARSQVNENDSSSNEHSEEYRQPIDEVDKELKPVIEINNDKDESADEVSKEDLKLKPNEDTSLEALLGVNLDSDEKSDKIVEAKDDGEKGNVKQQFERIPLNYNHDKKQEDVKTNSDAKSPKSAPETQNSDSNDNTGTLDTFAPTDHKYDEHLNIKFDDISIKLPEIKLPEDILSFAHDESLQKTKSKHQNKNPKIEKDKFFHYNEHEYNEELPHGHEPIHKDDDDQHEDYKDYYYGTKQKKEDYKKKPEHHEEEENDEEDLYEKFVRERFGKKGSFEKRSEKLQAPGPAIG